MDAFEFLTTNGPFGPGKLGRADTVVAGVDPDFIVDTGEHSAALRASLWEELLLEELGPGSARAEEWLALLQRLPLSIVVANRLAARADWNQAPKDL